MPYDSSLDATIYSQSWEMDSDRITVSIRSYNNGPQKLQITREGRNADGDFRFTKLGRMTKEESISVLPLIQEAVSKMQ